MVGLAETSGCQIKAWGMAYRSLIARGAALVILLYNRPSRLARIVRS